MPTLPQPLRTGDPITTIAPWSAKIIDYLRAITVKTSASVSVATTANGTTLTAAGQQTVRATSAESAPSLNQFLVTATLDPATAAAEAAAAAAAAAHGQTYRPTMRYWRISMLGGTAQAMFGNITFVSAPTRRVFLRADNPDMFYCYVSLRYRVSVNHDIAHVFDDTPVIETAKPENTEETFYFPVAVVDFNGTVLQGHLGAVYLARPWNVVEAPDEETEEGYVP